MKDTVTNRGQDGAQIVFYHGRKSIVALLKTGLVFVVYMIVAWLIFNAQDLWPNTASGAADSNAVDANSGALADVRETFSSEIEKVEGFIEKVKSEIPEEISGEKVSELLPKILYGVGWFVVVIGVWRLVRGVWMWLATKYSITSERVEIEIGIFSKRITTIELWRIKDIDYVRSFLEFFLGVASIRIIAVDAHMGTIRLGPLRDTRRIYDQLKEARRLVGRRAGAQAVGIV